MAPVRANNQKMPVGGRYSSPTMRGTRGETSHVPTTVIPPIPDTTPTAMRNDCARRSGVARRG